VCSAKHLGKQTQSQAQKDVYRARRALGLQRPLKCSIPLCATSLGVQLGRVTRDDLDYDPRWKTTRTAIELAFSGNDQSSHCVLRRTSKGRLLMSLGPTSNLEAATTHVIWSCVGPRSGDYSCHLVLRRTSTEIADPMFPLELTLVDGAFLVDFLWSKTQRGKVSNYKRQCSSRRPPTIKSIRPVPPLKLPT